MIMTYIEKLRREKHLTQKELALKIGKSREWYSQVLVRNDLKLSELETIAEILEVEAIELFTSGQRKKETKKETSALSNEIKLQREMIDLLKTVVSKQDFEIKNLRKK